MEGGLSLATLRKAARISNGFVADLKKLRGHPIDILDGIIWAGVTQANVALVTRNTELQYRFGTLDEPTPDELRRPVSIRSVAESLCIPFETTRRRVQGLVALGLLRMTSRGVISPSEALNSPAYRLGCTISYMKMREFYGRLRAIGLFGEPQWRKSAFFQPDDPPIRLAVRLNSDFVLRMFATVTQFIGDPALGLTLEDLIHANSQHLSDDAGIGDAEGPDGCIPDRELKPIRVSALAERLSLPYESVRRHVARFQRLGVCDRLDDGYIVPSRVLGGTAAHRYVMENHMHLKHMFSALDYMGVLAAWEGEAASGPPDTATTSKHMGATVSSTARS